jgi:nicotinate dehydrogenase subunit B
MALFGEKPADVYGATLTRRQFVKTGGALFVGVSLVGADAWKTVFAADGKNTPDPSLPSSWFEIRADNTVLVRTGKADFGQSTIATAYKQIVAEELRVPFEAITTVNGDTDKTPDGGGTFSLMATGASNLRKAAAYTYQALLDVAATRLAVSKSQLSVKDGVISGGGKRITYGELLQGQQLNLSIPVRGALTSMGGLMVVGNPPVKPVSEYTIVGKSYLNHLTETKVTAKQVWASDVRLPGMLHARVVHPKTLGSTLVSVGELDTKRFPNSRVVVKGNLVGVLAPTEWEAIGAAGQVAAATKWSDWKGLPGSDKVYAAMREKAAQEMVPVATGVDKGTAAATFASAKKTLQATYEVPYLKHAPIGPTVAVADARPDGTVYIYTATQNAQALRGQIALMLGTSIENVVVRVPAGSGHYGRSNGGNAGAEDEAVILSKAVGRPVRVQWSRPDDMMWSTQSSAACADIRIGLDDRGRISAYEADHYMPGMQDDRLVGALIAGLPTIGPPDVKSPPGFSGSIVNALRDPWLYDAIPNSLERGHGTYQFGQKASPIAVGLRNHTMRTPRQTQQNFPRELAISEAAALAGVDAIQFRLNHTTDARLIGVLNAAKDASGWETRPSPSRAAASRGSALRGQGVSVMLRERAYWACVCQVSVAPDTGKVTVDTCTVAVDPGIVVNPLQLKRQVEAGAIMGISHALVEEMTFDESAVTSRDWRSYPILTMADVPAIKVVLVNRPDVGDYGGGSEAANGLAAPAIAAAFFDATGKVPRRLPLKPAYTKGLLTA